MSQPYVGEIRMFGGSFEPSGWMFCDGQILPISEYETLFNLIGTTYGGDGQSPFALPDLRGRVPIHMGTQAGTTYVLAQMAGEESVTLNTQQMTTHSHAALATNNIGNSTSPQGKVLGGGTGVSTQPYGTDAPLSALQSGTVGPAGGSQPHENLQPYACINFIISLFGVFPSQT